MTKEKILLLSMFVLDFYNKYANVSYMTVEDVQKKITPVLEEHRVSYAAVFGSVARNEDTPESDVDLLMRLPNPMGMFAYMRLIRDLEQCLNKKVDVVTEQSLNKFVRPYISADLKVIYEGR